MHDQGKELMDIADNWDIEDPVLWRNGWIAGMKWMKHKLLHNE
jgi:hypothetical protein